MKTKIYCIDDAPLDPVDEGIVIPQTPSNEGETPKSE